MRFRRFSLLSGGVAVLFALCCAFLAREEGNGWLLWLAAIPLLAWRSGAAMCRTAATRTVATREGAGMGTAEAAETEPAPEAGPLSRNRTCI